jgi:CheY-like chemotaxis protein
VNARDAMPKGGTLELSAANVTLDGHDASMSMDVTPGRFVRITVQDSGTGMPPEIVEKIFDPFFTTKEVGKGTGLGLSTSAAIVKSHGGFVRVESQVGMGTRLEVYLPVNVGKLAEAAASPPAVRPRGHGELILVIDDEGTIRQITRQALEAFGYRVVVASDGEEAVAIYTARRAEIAAVLTDMMMPVMDGPATIQVLRAMSPTLPIIAVSGLSAGGPGGHAVSLGIDHFLPKPYSAETLLQTLQQVLAVKV